MIHFCFFKYLLIFIIILFFLYPYYNKYTINFVNLSKIHLLFRIKFYMKQSFHNRIYINENNFNNFQYIENHQNLNKNIYKFNYLDLINNYKNINSTQFFYQTYIYPIINILKYKNIEDQNKPFLISFDSNNNLSNLSGVFSKLRGIDDENTIIFKFEPINELNKIKYIKKIDIPWNKKNNKLFWRGRQSSDYNSLSTILVKKYFNYKNKNIDISYENNNNLKYNDFSRNIVTDHEILKSKFLIYLENHDTLVDLKCKMFSNSVIFMVKPTRSSWFMEELLIPNTHYILIKNDLSDLEEKYNWALKNQHICRQIVKNSNDFVNNFLNLENEYFIQQQLYNLYFLKTIRIKTNQIIEEFRDNSNFNIMNSIFIKNQQNKNEYKIPKVIIKTGVEEEDKLSLELQELFAKIKNDNPGFNLTYYSNTQCRIFIEKYFEPEVLNSFDSLKPGSYKADLFRYCILYINGGIYGDLTQRYKYPFERFIDFNKELFLVRDRIVLPYSYPGIQISLMAAKPGLKVFKAAINKIINNVRNRYYGKNSLDVTGPYLFRKVFEEYKDNINYQMILEETGSNLVFIEQPHSVLVTNKLPSINQILKRNRSSSYGRLWYTKRVYN